jgi:hypothetical protein
MEHHADFAVHVTHWLWIDGKTADQRGAREIHGWAIALGWWVNPGYTDDATGTLYLVVDEQGGAPVWIAEGNVINSVIVDKTGSSNDQND